MFLRTKHAKVMGLPCQKKRLRVRTLGGNEKEIGGKIFNCKIKDLKGQIYMFKAYGLDRVTGNLGHMQDNGVQQRLFPSMKKVGKMMPRSLANDGFDWFEARPARGQSSVN